MKHLLPLLVGAAIFTTACTSDNAEDLEPINPCPTEGLTYENTVKQIMETYCTSCHNPRGVAGWLDLTTYQGVKAIVDNGKFEERVFVLQDMPPTGTITACEQSKLTQWIADGAPEN